MCPNCQAPIRGGEVFCTNCGTALNQAEPPPQQQPFPTQQPGPQPYNPGPPGGWPNQAPGWQAPAQRQSSTPPFTFDIKRLASTDLAIGGATCLVLISLFLPWFGYQGYVSYLGISWHPFLAISLLASLALVAYLIMRAGWENLPFRLPIAHAPLLLVLTGVQLLFVLIAFLLKPAGLSWEFGAYFCLLAAFVASGVIAIPAIKSMQDAQQS